QLPVGQTQADQGLIALGDVHRKTGEIARTPLGWITGGLGPGARDSGLGRRRGCSRLRASFRPRNSGAGARQTFAYLLFQAGELVFQALMNRTVRSHQVAARGQDDAPVVVHLYGDVSDTGLAVIVDVCAELESASGFIALD